MNFEKLSLPTPILKALEKMGFSTPTEVQTQAIPVALTGKDLLASAQTGSGKTLAFCIPLIVKVIEEDESCALILTPTRELAMQITDVLYDLTDHLQHFRIACLIGGSPMFPQIRNLSKKPRFIVATPGRLNDHLERGTVRLNKFNMLVLDEADRMLDMGFAPQIENVISYLPEKRQTMLFSATFPKSIQKLIEKYLKNPERIITHKATDHVKTIKQETLRVKAEQKFDLLVDEINKRPGTILVFAKTRGRTEKVARMLRKMNINATFIHGDRSLRERREAIEGFDTGRFRVLVATDVAARGIDIANIAHVINLDLPSVAEDYVHRIGRTGRAGASGIALSLISPEEEYLWKSISRVMKGGSGESEQGHSGDGHKKSYSHKSGKKGQGSRPTRWKRKNKQGQKRSGSSAPSGPNKRFH